MVHSFPASLLKRPLDIPKGGAFVVYRRKKAELSLRNFGTIIVEISCVFSKWFSATVTGHTCDHVSFLPSGGTKKAVNY